MITPCGVEIVIGQQWREFDIRFMRLVEVVGIDEETRKVQITNGRRATWARLDRFHGKYGGYVLVPGRVKSKVTRLFKLKIWKVTNAGRAHPMFLFTFGNACRVAKLMTT